MRKSKKKSLKRNTAKKIVQRDEVLRRIFRVINRTDANINCAGYLFKPGETKLRLTIKSIKEIKANKSLKII